MGAWASLETLVPGRGWNLHVLLWTSLRLGCCFPLGCTPCLEGSLGTVGASQSARGLTPALSSWQCRIRPSVFKPVAGTGKGFLSMQSLAAHKGQKLWRSNGSLHMLACHPPLSPGPRASQARAQLLHALSLDEGGPEHEPSLSDSSSGGSFGRSPGIGPSSGPFSSSLGHMNHLGGSLDRASRSPKKAGPMAMLSCLPEPPPPLRVLLLHCRRGDGHAA